MSRGKTVGETVKEDPLKAKNEDVSEREVREERERVKCNGSMFFLL